MDACRRSRRHLSSLKTHSHLFCSVDCSSTKRYHGDIIPRYPKRSCQHSSQWTGLHSINARHHCFERRSRDAGTWPCETLVRNVIPHSSQPTLDAQLASQPSPCRRGRKTRSPRCSESALKMLARTALAPLQRTKFSREKMTHRRPRQSM